MRLRVGVFAGWLLACGSGAGAQPTITNLGVLPGGSYSIGAALSADGTVVAGTCGIGGGERAFRWTLAGGMQNLGVLPGGTTSNGNAISADGSQVAGMAYLPGNFPRAVRWDSGGIAEVGTLPSGSTSWGRGIRASGVSIVGYADTPAGDHAFATQGAALIDLGVAAGGTFSRAFAVSDDGGVIVGACDETVGGGGRAMRWSPGSGVVSLGTLPGGANAGSGANDVSGDGSVIVGSSGVPGPLTLHAFRWTSATGMVDLGVPAGHSSSYGDSTNQDGSIVVGFSDGAAGSRAFLWTGATGIVDLNTYLPTLGLNLSGWVLTQAYDVSADGTAITGFGTWNGSPRAWLVQGLAGSVTPCYPDCNGDTLLNLSDFGCFQTKFALQDPYADCNGDGVRNLSDFGCFQTKFALGCP